MDESVHEALAFNEEVEKKPTRRRKAVLNALVAGLFAGSYFIISQWGKDISPWVFLGFMVGWLGVIMWVGAHQGDVRPSYRQDPFSQPQPDKKYYATFPVLFAPVFFQRLLEGHMVIAAIVFTLWGFAVFWVLNSGAMDLSTRSHEVDRRASRDE
ncbi:hypothetical protein [uncultured Corynebacterium sp.]|uniref:hypothetical protein n=1 Tax=uncultured Corynebacterium sp. TaxID=159447 RepID=UPI0025FC6669|nr:hypothetical protein [uncultured Corynebacterium sp.]